MRKALFVFVSLLTSLIVNAQTSKISGMVSSTDGKAMEAASVSLLRAKDSALVKIVVADKAGAYEFEKIKQGDYLLQAEAVGHIKTYSPKFSLKADLKIDVLKLSNAPAEIGGVNVTAKRPLIENKIDKTVVNVDASTTNTGLSALEILEKSPGVTVDNDGNVSLKGKQGVIILIDGKPTYLSASDLANYLKNMPSDQLDQVEIMSQPSAKYDATGNSGVINIITKKNKANGFNGSINLTTIFAKYFKTPNSLNLNWRQGKFNVFANYSYAYWQGFNDINIDKSLRNDQNTPFNRYMYQHTYGRIKDVSHDFKVGTDFYADKNTTLGVVVKGELDNSVFHATGISNIYDSLHNFVQYNQAVSETKSPLTNLGFNLNFLRKLKGKDREITADVDYIFYHTPAEQYSYNYLYNSDGLASSAPYLLNGYLPSNIHIFSFKSDYKQPLKGDASLEAGIKTSFVTTNNDAQYTLYNNITQKWDPDDTLSNNFIYKENINAAYVNFRKKIKKISIQLGLRAEQTVADGNQVTKQISFHKNYVNLFPTAYFNYQKNDNNTFGLSFGRRIQRPGYDNLNPFQFQLDRYTYQQGNPNLQPQFSNNVELSYNYKSRLNIVANYTKTSGIINQVLVTVKQPLDSNYTTYQTSDNIASNVNFGLSANYNAQLKKWWSLNVFALLFNNHYKGVSSGQNIDVDITSFNANFSSQFTLKKGWGTEISGFIYGPNYVSSVIYARTMGMFAFGISKKILKEKATVKVNVRDPFYIMSFRGTAETNQTYAQIHNYWDNRRLILTFTYRFGKTLNQSPARKNSGAEDEQSRVKSGGNN